MHDLYVDELRGDTFVRGLHPESNVQFCLGYKVGGDFEAIVVGDTLAMPRDYRRELGVEATPSDTSEARGSAADGEPSQRPASSPMASSTARHNPESRVASTHLSDGIPRWASSHWLGAAAAGGLATHPALKTSSGAGLGQWSARSMAASGAGVAARSKSGAGLH